MVTWWALIIVFSVGIGVGVIIVAFCQSAGKTVQDANACDAAMWTIAENDEDKVPEKKSELNNRRHITALETEILALKIISVDLKNAKAAAEETICGLREQLADSRAENESLDRSLTKKTRELIELRQRGAQFDGTA